MKKYSIIILALILFPIFSQAVLAAAPNLGVEYANNLGLTGNNEDPRDAIVSIVRYFMTFLALIAVLVIIYGIVGAAGAGGNEEAGAKAKRAIIAGIVGLVVILAAFAIVQFVINTTSNIL